ncbi:MULTISPECIES: acyl-CoA dehydrogenase family protein [unclassified Iodidimonas]|jgi:(2S)-methylsuccinyl-CoA dehydrogenase|uniref:acyl-CoA dehydrogenase family protein n=1 Tax=unclassified Iodidimonas TaxID=2626145 RepID=UPI002482D7B4|nr:MULTISPECIES: acyl-CoA dehydrogenase family protein [unclassified Iodidimonas]
MADQSAAAALSADPAEASIRLPGLQTYARAIASAGDLVDHIRQHLAERLCVDGRPDKDRITRHQTAAHGLAWYASYAATLKATLDWAHRLEAEGLFGETEALILAIGCGEYLAQMAGGIAMSQSEIIRPQSLGLPKSVLAAFLNEDVETVIAAGTRDPHRQALAQHLARGHGGADGLDETLQMVRDTFRRFADKHREAAHGWHLADALIPLDVIQDLADLGVFGLTIPESHGGAGMGKAAMCVVSEELSRGYIGLGSLGTRSEIAAELILNGGTEAQKAHWLPRIASGNILPTAVFTEPNTGSDLGSLSTRAVRRGDQYLVTGNKTWITHAARADLMTLLVRTDPDQPGYKGLSMLLAEKPRGTEGDPFPAAGMSGGEIAVLGYRGMKEYELGFDGFAVDAHNLLGGVEGMGFKHLMATFESARIQTAARAVGVAQSALDLGLGYALDRQQFGQPILAFPRIYGKVAMMAAEIMMARQLCYAAAHQKDSGKRCDLEAGMAKLLAARIAWSAADNAVQIHGGNGYAMEYPISRVLVDARILNVFEGAAEIQANVIATRLLEQG